MERQRFETSFSLRSCPLNISLEEIGIRFTKEYKCGVKEGLEHIISQTLQLIRIWGSLLLPFTRLYGCIVVK